MLQHNKADDYVLSTGKTTTEEFVEKAFEYAGTTIKWEGEGLNEVGRDIDGVIRIKINSKYFRPSEVDFLLGLSVKAEKELGWKREYTLKDIIKDMFDNCIF